MPPPTITMSYWSITITSYLLTLYLSSRTHVRDLRFLATLEMTENNVALALTIRPECLAIKPVDKARLVHLPDEPRVDIVFRIGVLGRGNSFRQIFENSFEALQSGIRLDRDEAFHQLIGIFQFAFILDLHAPGERALGYAGIGAHQMDAFDHRLHDAAHDIGAFGDELLGRIEPGLLHRDIHLLHIYQDAHAGRHRLQIVRRLNDRAVDDPARGEGGE